ncbi:NPC intracellular cholesterol transporter 2 [Tetranychus urticae]|uniref:MD-2-related lipid-recognition domain-containing protein n=1 Tax=Tetranychus urticae TaxID=32264 RepID=T1KQB6_TETUR|nr:NPC intracellular cholesterol transporter 2 [Tetranychus urticae]
MIRGLVILALIATAFAGEIDFNDCGDGVNAPTSFEVAGCDEAPCTVERGNTYDFTFNFDAPVNADDLSVSIKAKVFGVWIPWPGAPKQVCGQGISCPLTSGKSYTYQSKMTIPVVAPSISTTVQYTLANTASETVFCNRFGVKVA